MPPKKQEPSNVATREGNFNIDTIKLPADVSALFDLRSNMEGIVPRLPQIGIIHQGQLFKMSDDTKVEGFTGIILQKQFCNAWWEDSFDESGGGTPPDCSSLDSITPDFNSPMVQAEKCKTCEKNKFGTDGRGKLCKNMVRVHIILDGQNTPNRLTLPPSNLRELNDYLATLTLKMVPYQLVYTKFTLEKATNKDGIEYSRIVFTPVGSISDPELANLVKTMLVQWMPAMTGQSFGSDEA
jgi:hypothetical protein